MLARTYPTNFFMTAWECQLSVGVANFGGQGRFKGFTIMQGNRVLGEVEPEGQWVESQDLNITDMLMIALLLEGRSRNK